MTTFSRFVVWILAAAATVALSTSCASLPAHVQLMEAPSTAAPVEVRRAFYLEHRLVALRPSTTSKVGGPPFVMLESGVRVDDAADLARIVDTDDALATHADRAHELYDAHRLWTGVGAVTGVVGATFMIVVPIGVLGANTTGDGGDLPLGLAAIIGGGLVGVAGLAMGAFGLSVLLPEAERQQTIAFQAYDAALRRRLALTAADIGPLARGTATADARGDFDLLNTTTAQVSK